MRFSACKKTRKTLPNWKRPFLHLPQRAMSSALREPESRRPAHARPRQVVYALVLYADGDDWEGALRGNLLSNGPIPTKVETWDRIKADRR